MKLFKQLIIIISAFVVLAGSTGENNSCGFAAFPFSLMTVFSTPQNTAYAADKKISFKVTFVELGSVNCIPCKMMQPVMKEIERKYGDQVNVVFHDVWTDEGKPFAREYGIRAIPTQVFLNGKGKEYFRHLGYFPFEEVEKILKQGGVR